jgi:hypothetical protein
MKDPENLNRERNIFNAIESLIDILDIVRKLESQLLTIAEEIKSIKKEFGPESLSRK